MLPRHKLRFRRFSAPPPCFSSCATVQTPVACGRWVRGRSRPERSGHPEQRLPVSGARRGCLSAAGRTAVRRGGAGSLGQIQGGGDDHRPTSTNIRGPERVCGRNSPTAKTRSRLAHSDARLLREESVTIHPGGESRAAVGKRSSRSVRAIIIPFRRPTSPTCWFSKGGRASSNTGFPIPPGTASGRKARSRTFSTALGLAAGD